jgi:hypothetical protein
MIARAAWLLAPALVAAQQSWAAPKKGADLVEAPGTASQPTTTITTPLTSQECKGLGGQVSWTAGCSNKGQGACITVDKHGVVRTACINETKEN